MSSVIEQKDIGISIGTGGSFSNTELVDGKIQLKKSTTNSDEYVPMGLWTSEVINIGDNFKEYGKLLIDKTDEDNSSIRASTRSSNNGTVFTPWAVIGADDSILSPKNQFMQVRIELYAGSKVKTVAISSADIVGNNEFVEEIVYQTGARLVPILTSNTSSSEGIAFSETQFSASYLPWRAFGNVTTNESYATANGTIPGRLGFVFNANKSIKQYVVKSMISPVYINSMPKDWVLQGSNDTTTGLNGNWVDLDRQINQSWATANTEKTYTLPETVNYKAYRLSWTTNNGYSYSGVGGLNFISESINNIQLKRSYQYNMTPDATWSETGSLHRKKITRDEWLRIDRMEVE